MPFIYLTTFWPAHRIQDLDLIKPRRERSYGATSPQAQNGYQMTEGSYKDKVLP